MGRRAVVLVGVLGSFLLTVDHANAAGMWGQASPAVFASGVQDTSPDAVLYSVSCASAGNCTAAGHFKNASGGYEAFTVTSTAGTWGQAIPAVFASGVQNSTPSSTFFSVSCASAGNCTAAGYFMNASGDLEAFTVTSTAGTWGQAIPAVFASGVQNSAPIARFDSVSCASAGNCTAVGSFKNASGGYEAFTMTSTAGTWGQAIPAVFASGVQNSTPSSSFLSVSCVSAGNCTATGYFMNASGGREAFTMTSTAGTWGQASPAVFASGVQNNSPDAVVSSVSCASAGDCTATGTFKRASGGYEAFTMTSTAGTWGQASPAVFASGAQNTSPDAYFFSVSCASAGNCTAVGQFLNSIGGIEAFTMTSTAGTWGQAVPAVFASGVQNSAPIARFVSVSCASAGNCTAAGHFSSASGGIEAFTMTSTAGTWGQAVPAVFASGVQSSAPIARFDSVSCASAGNCTAVGSFINASGGREAFRMTSVDNTPVPATTTTPTITTPVVPVLPATGSGVNGPVVAGLLALAVGVMVRSRQRRFVD